MTGTNNMVGRFNSRFQDSVFMMGVCTNLHRRNNPVTDPRMGFVRFDLLDHEE